MQPELERNTTRCRRGPVFDMGASRLSLIHLECRRGPVCTWHLAASVTTMSVVGVQFGHLAGHCTSRLPCQLGVIAAFFPAASLRLFLSRFFADKFRSVWGPVWTLSWALCWASLPRFFQLRHCDVFCRAFSPTKNLVHSSEFGVGATNLWLDTNH